MPAGTLRACARSWRARHPLLTRPLPTSAPRYRCASRKATGGRVAAAAESRWGGRRRAGRPGGALDEVRCPGSALGGCSRGGALWRSRLLPPSGSRMPGASPEEPGGSCIARRPWRLPARGLGRGGGGLSATAGRWGVGSRGDPAPVVAWQSGRRPPSDSVSPLVGLPQLCLTLVTRAARIARQDPATAAFRLRDGANRRFGIRFSAQRACFARLAPLSQTRSGETSAAARLGPR